MAKKADKTAEEVLRKQKEAIKKAAQIEACRRWYEYFVRFTSPRMVKTAFHTAMCERVQRFIQEETGNPYDVLLISTPPQYGKSSWITERLPAWCLLKNPLWRIIIASYGEDFAERFGRANRQTLQEYGPLFGIKLAKSPSGATEFVLDNNVGSVISRGIMSGITGRSAELIIIDDPVKNRMEADSETYRNRIWEEWQNSLKTRLQSGGKVICISTRWHEADLAGLMKQNDPYVQEWRVPCEAEDGDVLGRQIGEGLCPEIGKGTEWLQAFKPSYINDSSVGGLRAWNALFQGRPSSAEGNIVKRSWFRYHGRGMPVSIAEGGELIQVPVVETPGFFDRVWQSWDCTFKDGANSDFVCGMVFGRRLGDFYVLDRAYGRMDILKTMDAIRRMSEKWPQATAKLIEEKANGSAVISMLSKELGGFIPVNPKDGKVSRLNAVTPLIQAGNVYLPHPNDAPWVREFLDEVANFPNGSHDDMVDAFSQGLQFYMFERLDRSTVEIKEGTWAYQILKLKGYSDSKIRKAIKEKRIIVKGLPVGFL